MKTATDDDLYPYCATYLLFFYMQLDPLRRTSCPVSCLGLSPAGLGQLIINRLRRKLAAKTTFFFFIIRLASYVSSVLFRNAERLPVKACGDDRRLIYE